MHTAETASPGGRHEKPAAVLAGLGTCLPTTEFDNASLPTQLDTNDEWIRTRTGIAARRRAAPSVSMRDLACEAGANALRSAGLDTVGGLVLATTTPDRPCPAAAPEVAERLGLGQVPAFDISSVCSGFVYATTVAASLITSGIVDSVLVVAAELYSRIVDPLDRSTAVIFGDGAGAVVLRRGTAAEQGALLAFDLGSDGSGHRLIHVPGEREQPEGPRWFTMAGRKVYLRAVERMTASALRVMKDCAWAPETIGALVPHQANSRIIEAVAERLGVPPQSAVCELARVGNTAAASIPLALADALTTNQLKPGARTVLTAFGGGLSWGSAALVWPQLKAVRSEF
ncbi:beta-ketoacyl-ACP synthase III [Kitasatospora kifunensis]|uniref:Beta-ketoacyl-[acyl-carrier-protein] synthase III n=1 Tax=Kitasatospora kifunensis TaxID=58351 RepID=A0A7W7R6C3_KITKI|nr:beta-ketoacyl-ACP synthase III [Kitasatospora kifunensis]MBB4926184.1 3-oxoacyl-[acyl-carrier-protein] synthase-3 [Kitasatospora kifunensis]